MQAYSEMKDSGIEWLGRLPGDWSVSRVGSLFKHRNEKVSDKDFEPLSVTKKGIVPQLDDAAKTNDGDNRKKVLKGDFVINSRSDRKGSSGVSPLDGSVSLINTVLSQGKLDSRYTHHLLRSQPFQEEFYRYGQGIVADLWSTNYSRMKAIALPVPPKLIQQKIADFLDTETAQIDNLIAKQERLLELLEEKRRATITHAVTRGLNPGVELKETNIPWLGQVPSHWEVMTLKRLLRSPVTDGPHETPNFKDSGVPFLSVDGIQDGELDLINVRYISEEDHSLYSRKALVERGDILMGKAASTGKIAQVKTDTKFSIWSPLAILKFNPNINIDFIEYVLKSDYIQYHIDILCTNNTQKNISMRDIPRLIVGIPPQSEQLDIVNFVQDRERKAAALRGKIQTQITLLRERRTSLISHAVTGKIKV